MRWTAQVEGLPQSAAFALVQRGLQSQQPRLERSCFRGAFGAGGDTQRQPGFVREFRRGEHRPLGRNDLRSCFLPGVLVEQGEHALASCRVVLRPREWLKPAVPALDDRFSVVFAGNIGSAQAVQVIVEVATLLKPHVDVCLIIFGSGSELD